MNPSHLQLAIRATAAALAVFMTMATLDLMISIAEPQRMQLHAQTAQREAARVSATTRHDVVLAQAPASTSPQ